MDYLHFRYMYMHMYIIILCACIWIADIILGSVNVRVEYERGVLIFGPTVVHCSDFFFGHYLPFSLPGTHTGTGVESGLLGVSAGSSAEGGESKSPQKQASLEQRLSEVSPCNYIVVSLINFQEHHYCNSLIAILASLTYAITWSLIFVISEYSLNCTSTN